MECESTVGVYEWSSPRVREEMTGEARQGGAAMTEEAHQGEEVQAMMTTECPVAGLGPDLLVAAAGGATLGLLCAAAVVEAGAEKPASTA